jgi:MOSC domain-containing protein YiiM
MKLLSVNVGAVRQIEVSGALRRTGIHKTPAPGPVAVTRDGLRGDAICDVRYHGGADQAVYIYGQSDYDWWSESLGRAMEPGTFGENLTVGDLESGRCSIGDRFAVGSVLLEVTAPRIPCGNLSSRMNDSSFAERFRRAERPGLYCRVIDEGTLRAGDRVEYHAVASEDRVTVLEMFRGYYAGDLDEATLRRHLSAPIAIRDRTGKEKRLAKLVRRHLNPLPIDSDL